MKHRSSRSAYLRTSDEYGRNDRCYEAMKRPDRVTSAAREEGIATAEEAVVRRTREIHTAPVVVVTAASSCSSCSSCCRPLMLSGVNRNLQ